MRLCAHQSIQTPYDNDLIDCAKRKVFENAGFDTVFGTQSILGPVGPESCSKFLYVFKAARNGPLTPPTRASCPPPGKPGGGGHAIARRLACRADDYGPQMRWTGWWAVRGCRPPTDAGLGDAAELPRVGPVMRGWPGGWLRLLRLRRGHSGSGMRASRHPRPGQSRADPRRRPPAWVPSVKAALTRRAPAVPRSHGGRVEGDGIATAR